MTKHNYSREFKQDAIQYYLYAKENMTATEVAEHLGVGVSTLHKWVKQYQESGEVGRGSGNFSSDKNKEIAKLKRQLRDAEAAIQVLKNQSGF